MPEGYIPLPEELQGQLETEEATQKVRIADLDRRYMPRLTHAFTKVSEDAAHEFAEEVKDPALRQWAVNRVAELSKAMEDLEIQEYNERGYIGRWVDVYERAIGSLAEGAERFGTAFNKTAALAGGKKLTSEDAQFFQQVAAAKEGNKPFLSSDPGWGLWALGGTLRSTPITLGALATRNPVAAATAFGVQEFPDVTEELVAQGLEQKEAAPLAALTSAAIGSLETIAEPTGLMKGTAGAVKKKAIGALVKKLGLKSLKKPLAKGIARVAGETALSSIGEVATEAAQEATRQGTKVGVSRLREDIEDLPASGIVEAAFAGGKEAVGPALLFGTVGGGAQIGGMSSSAKTIKEAKAEARFQAFTGREKAVAKESAVEMEILKTASNDGTPSRAQWKRWGQPAEGGATAEQRKAGAKRLASDVRAHRQVEALRTGVPPTREEWDLLGFPAERGATPMDRQAYLQERMADARSFRERAESTARGEVIPENVAETSALETEQTSAMEQPVGEQVEPSQVSYGKGRTEAPATYDFPMEAEGTGEQISSAGIVKRLEQLWKIPIRFGRISGPKKGVRGIFKHQPRVIRGAKGEEASVAVFTHEIAHALAETYPGLLGTPPDTTTVAAPGADELAALDYDQSEKGKRPFEGWAEFMRGYITGGTELYKEGIDVRKYAPAFSRHFDEWLAAHPEENAKLQETKALVDRLRQAGAVGRVKGQISKTGKPEPSGETIAQRLSRWKNYLYSRLKDEGYAIKLFTKAAEEHGYQPGGDETTPYEDFNALRQLGPHMAANAVEFGVYTMTGKREKIGPSLVECMREINEGADYEDFAAWLYARHAIETWTREEKKGPGITLEDARITEAKLRNPRFQRAAELLGEFQTAVLGLLAETGAISFEEWDRITDAYKTYIPLERVVGRRGFGRPKHKMVNLSRPIKGRKGSGLQIKDPIETMIANTIKHMERASKQIITNNLVKVAAKTKHLGDWIERVPPKMIETKFNWDEIKSQFKDVFEEMAPVLEAAALDAETAMNVFDPMTVLSIWRPQALELNGEPIVQVIVDGKRQWYQLHPDLAEALGSVAVQDNMWIVNRVAKQLTGMMKVGATRLNPAFFAVKNPLRDYQTFLMQGTEVLKGAFDPAAWAAAYVYHEFAAAKGEAGDPVVEQFITMGGTLSTYAGLDVNRLKDSVKRALRGRQSWVQSGLNMAGTSEVACRLGEFAANLKELGWLDRIRKGESPPMDVLKKAINAAHDVTVDFRRMGKWGRYLNYWIPFFNANLEGLDKTIRTFKDNPTRTMSRLLVQRVPLAMIYWWYRHDNDDYKERPDWMDKLYVFTDTEGNPLFSIPKPHAWGLVDSAVERMMDSIYDKDPEALTRWFNEAIDTVTISPYPGGITPLLEAMFNYDFSFRKRPIVSESLQYLEAPDQYYQYTSSLAKQAAMFLHEYSGGKISLSPAKIDHVAEGISGGLYRRFTSPIEDIIEEPGNMPLGDILADVSYPLTKGILFKREYSKSVNDFYELKSKVEKKYNSQKKKGEIDSEVADLKSSLQSVATVMSNMRKSAQDSPEEEQREIERQIIGLARAALGRKPLERYPSPFGEGTPPE